MLEYLNNATVAAFAGAFAAYLLVQFTDGRRLRRRRRLLYRLIGVNRAHALGKIASLESDRRMLARDNRVHPAPLLQFSIEDIHALKMETVDQLSPVEVQAIDGLCYNMRAIDRFLDVGFALAEKLYELIKGDAPATDQRVVARELLNEYDSGLANLRRLVQMCDLVLAGKSAEMVAAKWIHFEHKRDAD